MQTQTRQLRSLARNATRHRGGFTLLEILVAVGAVAVVAAGLAVVFDSVGKTVSAGRRTSRQNQVANLLKDQLTQDFAKMTRDGFLVIRQSYADVDGDGQFDATLDLVSSSEGEAAALARARRLDEILFFQRGEFVSERKPVVLSGALAGTGGVTTPTAREAMIYYGHGEREIEGVPVWVNQGFNPGGNAGTLTRAIRLGGNDPDNPNALAGSWALVRRRVLLAGQRASESPVQGGVFDLPAGSPQLSDGECQASLQPASSSIFRAISFGTGPLDAATDIRPDNSYAWFANNLLAAGGAGPMVASGCVDVATTDLREIRRLVEGASVYPTDYRNPTGTGLDPFAGGVLLANDFVTLDRMRAWMENAMPMGTLDSNIPAPANQNGAQLPNPFGRIRYESTPPDFFNVVSGVTAPANATAAREGASRFGDHSMLASSALVTNCTEFVVEWTFGETDALGEVVWHGPPRRGAQVNPYPFDRDALSRPLVGASRTNAGATVLYDVPPDLFNGIAYAPATLGAWTQGTLTSTFGWTNTLLDLNLDTSSTTPNPLAQPGDIAEFPRWPWPTQIRVRATITDPLDPSSGNEQTYEFIFSTPSDGQRS